MATALLLTQATALNQNGVVSFANGDLPRALGLFRQALEVLGQADFCDDPVAPSGETKDSVCTIGIPGTAKMDEVEAFFVWNEAFLFAFDSEDTSTTSHRLAFLLSIVEFNLALILHLQSLRHGKTAKAQKAVTLYEISLTHAEHAMECGDAVNNIIIAASSNMAHILGKAPDRHEEAQQLLGDVLAIGLEMWFDPSLAFDTEDLNEFFLNAATYGTIKGAGVA